MDNIYDYAKIGARIREERKKAGLSMEELAHTIGTTRQTVSRFENGEEITIPLDLIIELCKVFECEIGYLLCEYDCKTREATDIQKATGLSEAAISGLFNRKAEQPEETAILSELISNPQMWHVLRYINRASHSKIMNSGKNGVQHYQSDSIDRVTLTGDDATAFFLNYAGIRFDAIIREMIGGENNE